MDTRKLRELAQAIQEAITDQISMDIVYKKALAAWVAAEEELDEIADLWPGVECENDDAVQIEKILSDRIKTLKNIKGLGDLYKGEGRS